MVEVWGLDPEVAMRIPHTRRYRLITKKSDLEKERVNKMQSHSKTRTYQRMPRRI
jgi:hypothetical protein